jgi:hypothetical protein
MRSEFLQQRQKAIDVIRRGLRNNIQVLGGRSALGSHCWQRGPFADAIGSETLAALGRRSLRGAQKEQELFTLTELTPG